MLNLKNLYANVCIHMFASLWSIFVGSFNLGYFVLMAKTGSGFFIVWVCIRVQFIDNAKYSLSIPEIQTNLINPKLLFCCSWSLVTSQFFFNWVDSLHARLNSHYERWNTRKRKRWKSYRNMCKEPCLLTLDLYLRSKESLAVSGEDLLT